MLAHRYAGDIQEGLLENANIGGENVHRGIVLGALMGAAQGKSGIPSKWITGLKDYKEIDAEIEAFIQALGL